MAAAVRRRRALGYAVLGFLAGLVLAIGLFFFLTRTEVGVERVRGVLVGQLQKRIEGEVRVGRIAPGRLLSGATVHDVEIDDERGRPFLRVDSARVEYEFQALLGGDIVLRGITLFQPTIVLERLPGDETWNFDRVLPSGDESDEPQLTLLQNVRIVDGTVVLRTPLELESPVEPGDTARLLIESAPGGLVRVMRFEDIDAELPRVLWETPEEPGSIIDVASFAAQAYIWEDPLEVRDLQTTIALRDSVFSFDAPLVRLPSSRAGGIGQLVFGEERTRVDVRIDGEDVAFRDLQWLYPPLPDEGGGTLTLRIETQSVGTLWLATDARLSAPGTEIAGTFGVVANDTLYFTNVDLRASPLDLALLDSVLPVDLPVDGLLVGTVVVDGPLSSLDVGGDLRLQATSPHAGSASVRWNANLDVELGAGATRVGIRTATADIGHLDGALLAAAPGGRAFDGSLSGTVTASGVLGRELRFDATARHVFEGGTPLDLRVEGLWTRDGGEDAAGGPAYVDLSLDIQPVVLDALRDALPQARTFRGSAGGTVRVRGTMAALDIDAELATSGGYLVLGGTVDLTGDAPRYGLEGTVSAFRAHEVVADFPETELTGRLLAAGQGVDPATADVDAYLVFDSARIRSISLAKSVASLRLSDGVIRLDSLIVAGPAVRLDARGAFGILEGRNASIDFSFHSDSLAALRGIFFGADASIDPEDIASPPYHGTVWFDGRLAGSVAAFDVEGAGGIRGLAWDGFGSDSAAVTVTAKAIGTDRMELEASLESAALRLHHREFDDARASVRYASAGAGAEDRSWAGEGTIVAEIGGAGREEYRLRSAFRRGEDGLEFDVAELLIDAGTVPWTLASPAKLRLADDRILIDAFEVVRTGGEGGRIQAMGVVPLGATAEGDGETARAPVGVDFDFEGVPLSDVLRVALPDARAEGTLAGRFNARGTAGAPVFASEVVVTDFRHQDLRLDRIGGQMDYRDHQLQGNFSAIRDGRQIAFGIGRIPIDLALTPIEERRRDEPMDIQIRADSMPVALLTGLLDGFTRVEGHLDGAFSVAGTTLDPVIAGEMELTGGRAHWAPIGVQFSGVDGVFRVVGNREVALDATVRAGTGRASATGSLHFDESLRNPRFDLGIEATEFHAARRRDVDFVVTGQAHLSGTYRAPVVDATLRVDRGTMNLDEVWRQYLIVELETPFLMGSGDSAAAAIAVAQPTNPFLRNVSGRASLSVGRDSWLRSREMNVEVAGDLIVEFDRAQDDFRITGSLAAVRGSYLLAGRRFTVREGIVDFPGTPGIDPNLDITAMYRARAADGDPLDISAIVSGTLQTPRVALTSDVQPPISESDLISYLLFGRPTYALAGQEDRVVDRVTGLTVGFVGPALWGIATSGLETFAQTVGLDYLSISASEAAPGAAAESGIGGIFAGTRVEIGRYLSEISPNLFLALSQRIGASGGYGRGAGARVEWRILPTWTAELFVEDRFARTPSFGLDQTGELRKVWGFFLYREWGFREWRWPWSSRSEEVPAAGGDPPPDSPDPPGG